MICYKGNSFFRIFKILIKDFVEKVKLSFMKRFTNFRRDMSKKNLFFVQIKKFFVQKNKKTSPRFFPSIKEVFTKDEGTFF